MIKTANEGIHARIRRARAVIGAGVRLAKPDLEAEGRADYAESVIENQVLLYGAHLTQAARNRLVQAIFDTDKVQPTTVAMQGHVTPADIVSDEEMELAKYPVRIVSGIDIPEPDDYDPDSEVDDEEI